jgi:putative ABC transport system permease protein
MLRTLLPHPPRLLSALVMVLGTMVTAAACVPGDGTSKGFVAPLATVNTVNQNVDVQVTARDTAPGGVKSGPHIALVDRSIVDKVRAVPGVAKVAGVVYADGARVVGMDGRVVTSDGPPRAGIGWSDQDTLARLREGRAPQSADEIAIDAGLAGKTGYAVGDRVDVLTLQPRKAYTLVGVFGYRDGQDSLAGETTVAFTMATAQEVMLDAPGKYTAIDVTAASGVSDAALRARIADALGPDFVVCAGAETADKQPTGIPGSAPC